MSKNDTTPKHVSDALLVAASGGNMDIIRFLMMKVDVDVNICDSEGNTPLILAAKHNHFSLVQWLVEDKHANVNEKNQTGNSALFFACWSGA